MPLMNLQDTKSHKILANGHQFRLGLLRAEVRLEVLRANV